MYSNKMQSVTLVKISQFMLILQKCKGLTQRNKLLTMKWKNELEVLNSLHSDGYVL